MWESVCMCVRVYVHDATPPPPKPVNATARKLPNLESQDCTSRVALSSKGRKKESSLWENSM